MKGYININLNGQQVGLKFARPALIMFGEATEKRPDLYLIKEDKERGIKADFTIEGLAKFIQCGYLNNCLIKEVEPSLTYEDFFNYAEGAQEDEGRVAEIGNILTCYGETIYAKKLADEFTSEEKKTLIGTT